LLINIIIIVIIMPSWKKHS